MEVPPMIQQHVESSGRSFSSDEISLIRQTVKTFSSLSLTELSKTLCELLEWKRPNGKLKHEECRALLEHLQTDGMISLPKLRATAAPGPRKVILTAQSDRANIRHRQRRSIRTVVFASCPGFRPRASFDLQTAHRTLALSRLPHSFWRPPELSCRVSKDCPASYLACLQFSSPAWKMAPRDAWIGWSDRRTQTESSVHRFQQPFPHSALRFRSWSWQA